MNHYTVQTFSNTNTHSDELQLSVLKQQNKQLQCDNISFEAKHYQHQDELNLFRKLNLFTQRSKTTQISLFCSIATVSPFLTR